jgi:uncharacterized protein YndB with AHSA1/START domain
MSAVIWPDLTGRPWKLSAERMMTASPAALFQAWTERFDLWFAAPESVLMEPEVNAPFFFETAYEGKRYPHYGRFLALEEDNLVQLTWVTGPGGTKGAETVVTVRFTSGATGTHLSLMHEGFPDEESMRQHEEAWPLVLAHQDDKVVD